MTRKKKRKQELSSDEREDKQAHEQVEEPLKSAQNRAL